MNSFKWQSRYCTVGAGAGIMDKGEPEPKINTFGFATLDKGLPVFVWKGIKKTGVTDEMKNHMASSTKKLNMKT